MKKQPQAEPGQDFTAGDVRNATGMSYRQLNDWDSKGALPNEREDSSSWRRFKPREVFALMVCKEIRDTFGVPLESLKYVQDFMTQPGPDHLQAAIELMARGFSVNLLTDLKETFIMDTDLEFQDLFSLGYFRGDNQAAYILLRINPLVNKLLTALKMPVELKVHDKFYEAVRHARGVLSIHSLQELEVMKAIRQGDYKRVIVTKKNDDELLLELEQELSAEDAAKADLNAIIAANDFQTVTVKRHAGRNVHLKRTLPAKLRKSGD